MKFFIIKGGVNDGHFFYLGGGFNDGHVSYKKIIKKWKEKTNTFLGHLKIGFRGAKGVFKGQVLTDKIPFLDKIECHINKNRGGGVSDLTLFLKTFQPTYSSHGGAIIAPLKELLFSQANITISFFNPSLRVRK